MKDFKEYYNDMLLESPNNKYKEKGNCFLKNIEQGKIEEAKKIFNSFVDSYDYINKDAAGASEVTEIAKNVLETAKKNKFSEALIKKLENKINEIDPEKTEDPKKTEDPEKTEETKKEAQTWTSLIEYFNKNTNILNTNSYGSPYLSLPSQKIYTNLNDYFKNKETNSKRATFIILILTAIEELPKGSDQCLFYLDKENKISIKKYSESNKKRIISIDNYNSQDKNNEYVKFINTVNSIGIRNDDTIKSLLLNNKDVNNYIDSNKNKQFSINDIESLEKQIFNGNFFSNKKEEPKKIEQQYDESGNLKENGGWIKTTDAEGKEILQNIETKEIKKISPEEEKEDKNPSDNLPPGGKSDDIPPAGTEKKERLRGPDLYISHKDDINDIRDNIKDFFGDGTEPGEIYDYYHEKLINKRDELYKEQSDIEDSQTKSKRDYKNLGDKIGEDTAFVIYGGKTIEEGIFGRINQHSKGAQDSWKTYEEKMKAAANKAAAEALNLADAGKWDLYPTKDKIEICSRINGMVNDLKLRLLTLYQNAVKKNSYNELGAIKYDFTKWKERRKDEKEKKYRDSYEGRSDFVKMQDIQNSLKNFKKGFNKLKDNEKEIFAYAVMHPGDLRLVDPKISGGKKQIIQTIGDILDNYSDKDFIVGGENYISKYFEMANKDDEIISDPNIVNYANLYERNFKEKKAEDLNNYFDNILKNILKDTEEARNNNFTDTDKDKSEEIKNGTDGGSFVKTENVEENILYKKYVLLESEKNEKVIRADSKKKQLEQTAKDSVIKLFNLNIQQPDKEACLKNIAKYFFRNAKDLNSNSKYYIGIVADTYNNFLSKNKGTLKKISLANSQYSQDDIKKATNSISQYLSNELNTLNNTLNSYLGKINSSVVTEEDLGMNILQANAAKNQSFNDQGVNQNVNNLQNDKIKEYNINAENIKKKSPIANLFVNNKIDSNLFANMGEDLKTLYNKNKNQFMKVFKTAYSNFCSNNDNISKIKLLKQLLNIRSGQDVNAAKQQAANAQQAQSTPSVVTSGAVGDNVIPDRLYKKIIRRRIHD